MKFSVFQISRRGGREKNEDRMGYCYTRESGLFVLADGMGGHPEGEVAAQIALQTISALFQRQAKPQLENVQEFLSSALLAAHHQILRYATEKGMLDTPRTTLVAAVVQAGAASWIHCGDSRKQGCAKASLMTMQLARTRFAWVVLIWAWPRCRWHHPPFAHSSWCRTPGCRAAAASFRPPKAWCSGARPRG